MTSGGGRREEGSPGAGTGTPVGRLVLASGSGDIYGCKYIRMVCVSGVSPWSSVRPCGCGRDGALGCGELPPLCAAAFPWLLPDALVRSRNEGSLPAHLPAAPACMAPTLPFSYLLQAACAEPSSPGDHPPPPCAA